MAYISKERAEQLREKESAAAVRASIDAQAAKAVEAARLAAIEVCWGGRGAVGGGAFLLSTRGLMRCAHLLSRWSGSRLKSCALKARSASAHLRHSWRNVSCGVSGGVVRSLFLRKELPNPLSSQPAEFLAGEQEAARERTMVDAILSKIASEDAAEAAAAAAAREATIRAIDEFKAQRERAVAAALASEREEEARTAAYLAAQAAREEDHKRARATNSAERDSQYRAIVAEQEAARARREEEDALRWILVEEEAERRREADDARKRAAEERSRTEMRAANEQQRMCVVCKGGALVLCASEDAAPVTFRPFPCSHLSAACARRQLLRSAPRRRA